MNAAKWGLLIEFHEQRRARARRRAAFRLVVAAAVGLALSLLVVQVMR